jgi:hypothetical protein
MEAADPRIEHDRKIHEEYVNSYFYWESMRFRHEFVYDQVFGALNFSFSDMTVADLASKVGFNSLELLKRFPTAETIGFDISEPACAGSPAVWPPRKPEAAAIVCAARSGTDLRPPAGLHMVSAPTGVLMVEGAGSASVCRGGARRRRHHGFRSNQRRCDTRRRSVQTWPARDAACVSSRFPADRLEEFK